MPDSPPPIPGEIRIQENALVIPKSHTLPRVCIYTGSTEDLIEVRQKVYWHSPWLYLLVLVNLLIFIIVSLSVRKTAEFTYFISVSERSRRRKWHLLNWGVFLMTFVSLIVAGTSDLFGIFFLAPLFLVGSIVIYYLHIRGPYAKRIDQDSIAVCGIAPEVMRTIAG